MGFFNDVIRGATPAISGGMDIGLRGMAEAQRRKEEAEMLRRQSEQQAFANLMAQQNYGLNERQQNFTETQYQEGAPLRSADLGYKTAATNKMTAEYDPNNPITSADLDYKKAQSYRLMHPVDTNISAAESWNQGLSNLSPEEQENAYRIKYGLSPKATVQKGVITQQDVTDVYLKLLKEYDPYDDDPQQSHKPTIQQALGIAQQISNGMNPQQQSQPNMQPIQDGGNGQRAPMGAQGQPVSLVGGQPQPQMDRATILKQKFDADPSSLTPEEFDELGMYLNGGK